jgi:phthiocerol/phenolphthiocerol synthesis type-I polyketide synthase E
VTNNDNVSLDTKHPTTLLLSAETPEALDEATRKLAAWAVETCSGGQAAWPLPDVAAALRDRCRPLPQRRAIRVESWQDALAALADKTRWAAAAALAGTPKLLLSFPGQGSLRPGVLSRLLAGAPAWARHLERYARLARDMSGFDCAAWLADPQADADSVLRDNGKTQLAIFCTGASLGRWLLDLGLRPDGFVGHSLGEWMGANLAGVLSDEHAVRAVHHRGRLMQATGPGAALIVRATPEALQTLLADSRGEPAGFAGGAPSREGMGTLPGSPSCDISLACVNAPNLCLVSGRPEAITSCNEKLSAARVITRPAPIHVAVHSPVMDAVIEPFLAELAPLDFAAPRIRLLSTVTGEWMTDAQARDRAYWAQQLRRPVRFDKAATTLVAEPTAVILEVGMGAALTSLIATQARGKTHLRALPLLGRDEPPAEGYDPARVHQTFGELWASGVDIDLVGEVGNGSAVTGLPV